MDREPRPRFGGPVKEESTAESREVHFVTSGGQRKRGSGVAAVRVGVRETRMAGADAWVAAAAWLYQMPLLTTDSDFLDLDIEGLDVIHPKA